MKWWSTASRPHCRCSGRWCGSLGSSTATTISTGWSSTWPASRPPAERPKSAQGTNPQSLRLAMLGGSRGGYCIRLSKTAVTPDAAHRDTIGQILLLAAGGVVLTVISAGSVHLVNRAREDARWVVHSIEIENQLSFTQLQVRRAESAQRGYLSTLRSDFQTDFENAASELTPALMRLSQLVSDSPVQKRQFDEMLPLISQRIEEFRRTIELARTQRTDQAARIVREGIGREAMKRIDGLAGKMRAEEDRLFVERRTNADRSQTLAASMTGIGSGFIVVLAGISIFLVRRSLRARDRAEGSLRDNNLNLEATVDERTADLREANNEIQRFAYIVSHDLRSPLVNVMGFTSELDELGKDIFRRIGSLTHVPADGPPAANDAAELMLAEPDRQLAQDFSEALGFIKSSIAKMDRLISAILNLTREGRREFEPVRIDTRELIEAIASTVAHQAVEADARFQIGPLPAIVSDRLALEQIFSNLIDN